ncbi:MAG: hypothetical protein J7K49_02540 [Thaumarchaeota archaeon]|nr:hypothetical protein [Nitrososphaerota archaeon]
MASLSRVPVEVIVENIGKFEGELIRFYAPLTVQEIVRMLPIEGAAALWDYAVYFEIGISRGLEKEVKKVKPGDMLFWPPRSYVLLAFAEAMPAAQMMKIGEFKGDYSKLKEVRPGSKIIIRKRE